MTHDPLGNPVDRRHPWNQHTIPAPQKRDFDDKYSWTMSPRWFDGKDHLRARHRRRPAGPAVGDGAGRAGRHRRSSRPPGTACRSTCRAPILKPEVELRVEAPGRQAGPAAVQRDRAQPGAHLLPGLRGRRARCTSSRRRSPRCAAGNTKTWEKFTVPGRGDQRRVHRGGPRRALPPHGHPRREDRELPPVPADAVERQRARQLRHARPVRGRRAEHADLRGEPQRRLQGHRHHARGPQLRPVPALRRAHVHGQREAAAQDALARDAQRRSEAMAIAPTWSRRAGRGASRSCSTASPPTGGPARRAAAEELVRRAHAVLRRRPRADRGDRRRRGRADTMVHRMAADPLVGGPARAARPAPGAGSTHAARARAGRPPGGGSGRTAPASARPGSTTTAWSTCGSPGGGCGVDTVADVVAAAIGELAPGDQRASSSTRAPAGPPLLQIGVRPPERVVRDLARCAGSCVEPDGRGAGAGAVRAVRHAGAAAAPAPRAGRASGGCSARAGRAGSCSTTPAPGAAATGGCPTGTCPIPVSRSSDAQWDALQIPVGMAFFLRNSAAGQVVACYPSPAGATESELTLDGVGGRGRRRPRWPPQLEPDVEALLVRRGDAGRGGGPEACSSRSTPATGSSGWCACTGGLRRRHRGLGGDRRASSTSCGPTRARLRRHDVLRFACTGARPEPYAAGPSLQLDLRVSDGQRARVHAVALRTPDPDRAAPPPLHRAEEADGWSTCSASRPVGRDAQPAAARHRRAPRCRASPGSTTVPLAVPLTYDLDIAATKYFHGLADGEVPLLLLFSGTVFYAGAGRACRSGWCRGTRRRRTGCRWRCGGRRWTRTSRTPAGCGCAAAPWTRCRAYRSEHALPTWDDDAGAAAEGGRRVTRRTGAWPRSTRSPPSPTRCCSRATCSTPTGPRRRRTGCAGSSACSPRAG